MTEGFDRRDFLKRTLAAGAGLGALSGGAPREARAQDGDPHDGAKLPEKVPRGTLGKTGASIPILLMGCAQKFDPRYDKMLHRAFKEGIDYLDTALEYARGQSHRTLAPFIQQVGREKLWITSKAPHHRNSATVETFTRDLETCLTQLEVDHLDLFFMHGLNDVKYLADEYLAMGARLKEQGKTRFFGFSCHDGNVVELLETAAQKDGIDAVMFRYNFAQYGDRALSNAIDACKERGIGLIAMKTMRSVPNDQEEVEAFRSKEFTLPQAKLKAVWADERIDAAVSHIDNMTKLKENVAAAKSPVKLGMSEFQQLQRLAARTACVSCQGCSHRCEPAAGGEVKIAAALRFLMYHECYDEPAKARELYRALTPVERALDDRALARAGAACPEGIDVAARLRRAASLLG